MHKIFGILLVTLLIWPLSACDNSEEETTNEPSNLTVEITVTDDINGTAEIQASAENTVEYELWISGETEAYERNASGTFTYTFGGEGTYPITLRAYGVSGKYVKAERDVVIGAPGIVPLSEGHFSPMEYDGYTLIWNDEFNGTAINTDNWGFDIGDGCPNCGWGNNEWEYYRSENATVADSVLTIEAREESYGGKNYTSARLKTQGRFSFQYGRVDIRALLPRGQGIWPALWMLGENISSVGWPACGEIDIMEMIGGSGRENEVHGTLHWDSDGHAMEGTGYSLSQGTFAESYHVFSLIWEENAIKWLVDDVQYQVIDVSPTHMSEFRAPFFLIFNVAVGGNWPGYPDDTTVFPQYMKVDYVRVFQLEN